MANKWMEKLRKIEGAYVDSYDPFSNCVRSQSPGVNFCFGRTHGLPRGYSLLLWGEPKAGKTYLSNSFIADLHQNDPDAIAVKFDTEFRDLGQMQAADAESFGIDQDRYQSYGVNSPAGVFDAIESKIGPLIDAGAPIALIIIDSITGIQGRREANSETIEQHNIGDHAQTVQIGLKRILPLQRRGKISLIVTAHSRAELDMWEQKRGNKTKAAASFGVQHHCEYWLNIKRNRTAKGRTDALGRTFQDDAHKDMKDEGDLTGHKVVAWMQGNSVGPADRQAEFTIDYQKGIINQHEEVFRLGTRWGIIGHPNPKTYIIDQEKFNGEAACIIALEKSPKLQKFVVAGLLQAEKEKRIMSTEIPEQVDDLSDLPIG